MWDWLGRNSDRLQALGGLVTALAALAALVIVPAQIASADRIQRDQTAREIYREFLNLTVQRPELARADYCALKDPRERTAYEAYVDYLLYTAEQLTESSPDWRGPMAGYLADHRSFICSKADWGDYSEGVVDLVKGVRADCTPADMCGQD